MTSSSADFVEIRQLRKSFGGADVLKGVDLVFRLGEIHAFIGANGAGKSTLLGCLSGAVEPSSGTIAIDGEVFDTLSPRLALEKGIGIIYQHFQVVEGLTVADNIFLGSELRRMGIVDTRQQNERAAALLARLGAVLAPDMPLERLSVGERQIVEIARALRIGPKVLILDEPTAALSDREMSALHDVVRTLAHAENIAIVYVTHLIDEIKAIADCVTVLRDGAVVWTRPAARIDSRQRRQPLRRLREERRRIARRRREAEPAEEAHGSGPAHQNDCRIMDAVRPAIVRTGAMTSVYA